MKISVIGGGSWGTTLAQVLDDNGHETLIFDINQEAVNKINNGIHPFFNIPISKLRATTSLKEAVDFSDYILLAVPTKVMRETLVKINNLTSKKLYFINVSKGIEPDTLMRTSQIVNEVIDPKYYGAYASLTGPSHAEELILRKLTLLTSASDNFEFAKKVQLIFNNDQYLRIYTSDDLIGCEVGATVKNAIAVVSGIITGYGLGENARAALITRSIIEIVRVVTIMGGKKETAFGLTGIGDLIVTCLSENSRNFKAGKKIGEGQEVGKVLNESIMVVEGIRSIEAMHHLSEQQGIELPIINVAYDVIFNGVSIQDGITSLLSRTLKSEVIE